MSVGPDTSTLELAAIVSTALQAAGATAVLSGGAAVTIHTNNRYQSFDLDFVSDEKMSTLAAILEPLGFVRGKGRYFEHPRTELFVEFPPGPLAVGGEILTEWLGLETEYGTIQVLTPTQMTMDRLAAFFHWNDPQALDQAVLIARENELDWPSLEAWTSREGAEEKYQVFKRALERGQA